MTSALGPYQKYVSNLAFKAKSQLRSNKFPTVYLDINLLYRDVSTIIYSNPAQEQNSQLAVG